MKKLFLAFASISVFLMTGCVFTRPSQVLVWRSNSSLMATEGETATITKGDEGNAVNADKTSSSEAKAVVSGTGPASGLIILAVFATFRLVTAIAFILIHINAPPLPS